jgi:hypothetical protein
VKNIFNFDAFEYTEIEMKLSSWSNGFPGYDLMFYKNYTSRNSQGKMYFYRQLANKNAERFKEEQ